MRKEIKNISIFNSKYGIPFTMDRVDYQSMVIQDIITLNKKGELNKTPWYQRRSVWNTPQQSYLINTLLERKPIPAIYIRYSLDLEKGVTIKEVVDGQQRVTAIIDYIDNDKFTSFHPDLKKRVKFSKLSPIQRERFLLTAIPVGYLLGANDADVIDIFARINSVAKTLNKQEKRNALYSGEFKQFAVNESTKRVEFWKDYQIFTGNSIARMDEVQFISDVTINFIEGIIAFNQSKIDKYYKENEDAFAESEDISKRFNKIFDVLLSLNPNTIKQTIFFRQPIFFSLMLVIDRIKKPNINIIQKGLTEIDNRFNSDVPLDKRTKDDLNFYNACSATTQSSENRKTRDKYISKFIE